MPLTTTEAPITTDEQDDPLRDAARRSSEGHAQDRPLWSCRGCRAERPDRGLGTTYDPKCLDYHPKRWDYHPDW